MTFRLIVDNGLNCLTVLSTFFYSLNRPLSAHCVTAPSVIEKKSSVSALDHAGRKRGRPPHRNIERPRCHHRHPNPIL